MPTIRSPKRSSKSLKQSSKYRSNSPLNSLKQSSKCDSCGEWLIGPERSAYVSEQQVSSFWVCPKCGNEFATSIHLTEEVPLTPEVVDTFFPSLLVA
jgi:uncharacterized protein with PIN domain